MWFYLGLDHKFIRKKKIEIFFKNKLNFFFILFLNIFLAKDYGVIYICLLWIFNIKSFAIRFSGILKRGSVLA